MEKKSVREPIKNLAWGVAASLLAAAIIAAVHPLRDIAWAMLKGTWTGVVAVWHHLGSASSVPWWIVYAMLGLLAWAGIAAIRRVTITTDPGEDPRQYRQDKLLNDVVWRWRLDDGYNPFDLAAFCPRCDLQIPLNWQDPSPGLNPPIVCDRCGYELDLEFYSVDQVESLIKREIQRKIRTGEWKKTVGSSGQPA